MDENQQVYSNVFEELEAYRRGEHRNYLHQRLAAACSFLDEDDQKIVAEHANYLRWKRGLEGEATTL